MPQFISFGLSYKLKNLNLIGEYSIQDWSNYQLFGQTDDLISSEKLNIGIEYQNQNSNSAEYLSKAKYRFGFYNFQTPIQLNNNKINETGLTLGIGYLIKEVEQFTICHYYLEEELQMII